MLDGRGLFGSNIFRKSGETYFFVEWLIESGRYPFLDIGIVRCDWLRSKPKQSKFGRELLEMSRSETNF